MERVQKLVVVAALLVVAMASSGMLQACYAQSICNMPLAGLMACKPAVTRPKPAAPTPACCSALSHADMTCLCSYKNSKVLPSFGIDPKLAIQLPAECKLPHPPNC